MTQSDLLVVADVAVLQGGSAPDVLSYRIPEATDVHLQRGLAVWVTVRGKPCLGYVVATRTIRRDAPLAAKLVDIAGVAEDVAPLSDEEIELAHWISGSYLASLGDALKAVRPGPLRALTTRLVRVTESGRTADPDTDSRVRGAPMRSRALRILQASPEGVPYHQLARELSRSTSDVLGHLCRAGLAELITEVRPRARPKVQVRVRAPSATGGSTAVTAAQQRVLDALASAGEPRTIEGLARTAGVSRSVVEALVRKGLLTTERGRVHRGVGDIAGEVSASPDHTDEQRAAVDVVLAEMDATPEARLPVLIHGVTASGKTEVYLEAIRVARSRGRSAIVLVPEIALAAQVVDVVARRFGPDVAVLHSRLSSGERYDEWHRVADGSAGVAVGARSAVFAPVRDLGLIVIDEEHEAAYKQETAPRYDARQIAFECARRTGAVLLLGSATPSLESYHAALSGRMRLAVLRKRATGAALPEIVVVDMRREFRKGPALFSERLVQAIREALDRREQVLLFLNRRGYAAFVLCRDCGYVATCPNCAVSLTYHAAQRSLRCHHCDHVQAVPVTCPDCEGDRLRGFGLGTERIEQEVRALFPEARVLRMDRDTTSQKSAHARIIRAFRNGDADILIGTQMIAKGLDFPHVTLVGVVSADVGLHIPDFRAAERSFQTLAQVAGRAGRAAHPGLVLIQTFTPHHYAVECAASQDYEGFFQREIEQRRELEYPPFTYLTNIVSSAPEARDAMTAAMTVADELKKDSSSSLRIIGPAPAPIARLRGDFRWHVVLKSSDRAEMVNRLRRAMANVGRSIRASLTVDVDPISLA